MKYHATWHVEEGELAGKWLNIDFEADSDDKAIAFIRELVTLKTQNGKPVKYGPYLLQRRIFPLFWHVLESTIVSASYKPKEVGI